MYIERLKIESVKLLRNVEIDFTRQGEIRNWTVIVGPNGLCKTTILKAIALAASGGALALRLNAASSLADRRLTEPKAGIEGTFRFSKGRHRLRTYPQTELQSWTEPPRLVSELHLPPKQSTFLWGSRYTPPPAQQHPEPRLDPLTQARGQQLPDWFVAGYGVHRNLPTPYANTHTPEDNHFSRVEPLFEAVSPRGPGFADIFTEAMTREFNSCLQQVFISGGLLPQIETIELRGRNGVTRAEDILLARRFVQRVGAQAVSLPATWLSHGYQATISWVADLVGQIFLEAGKPVAPDEMEGIVLVDELDLHLHPTWQVSLVSALRAVFPRIQFIATTHSPMVLPALRADEVLVLHQDDQSGDVDVHHMDEAPELMTGSELYERFFSLQRVLPGEVIQKFARYSVLNRDAERNNDEETERLELLTWLQKHGFDIDASASPEPTA